MWKIFAIICIPVINPLGITQEQCQMYYEINERKFTTEIECDAPARAKAEEMLGGFVKLEIPFTRMQFGCEKEDIN